MDQTPATGALDARRRRLLFRATHRGTRENDILVGGFVAARIAAFSDKDMVALEAIMELPDPAVADWLTGRAEMPENDMLRAMRAAALSKKDLLFEKRSKKLLSIETGVGAAYRQTDKSFLVLFSKKNTLHETRDNLRRAGRLRRAFADPPRRRTPRHAFARRAR